MKNSSEITKEFVENGYSQICPVIDTHTHFGPGQGIYFPNLTPEQMIDTMDRCGVKYLITAPHTALVDTDRGNMIAAELVTKHPESTGGIAEAARRLGRRQAFDEIGSESLILAMQGVDRLEEEASLA